MPKLTYKDKDKDAPEVDVAGKKLKDGESVEVDEETAKRFRGNPWFDVSGAADDDKAAHRPAATTSTTAAKK